MEQAISEKVYVGYYEGDGGVNEVNLIPNTASMDFQKSLELTVKVLASTGDLPIEVAERSNAIELQNYGVHIFGVYSSIVKALHTAIENA